MTYGLKYALAAFDLMTSTTMTAPRPKESDTWHSSFYKPEILKQRGVSAVWSPQLDALAPDTIGSTPLDVSFRDHALRKLKELRDYDRAIFDAECWKRGVDPDEIFGKTSGDHALK